MIQSTPTSQRPCQNFLGVRANPNERATAVLQKVGEEENSRDHGDAGLEEEAVADGDAHLET